MGLKSLLSITIILTLVLLPSNILYEKVEDNKQHDKHDGVVATQKGHSANVRDGYVEVVVKRMNPHHCRKAEEIPGMNRQTDKLDRTEILQGNGSVLQGRGCGYHGVPVTKVHHTVVLCLWDVKYFILHNAKSRVSTMHDL